MRLARAAALLVLPLAAGCVHGPLSEGKARRLSNVAVVARVESVPVAWVARGDPTLASQLPGTPKAADARLEEIFSRTLPVYELEEMTRVAFVGDLGTPPPWRLASPLDVASALGTLLAREREPDWKNLVPLGVDGVFDLAIVGWGAWDAGPQAQTAAWIDVRARLLEPASGRVLWQGEVRVNRSQHPEGAAGRIDLPSLAGDEDVVRAALADVVSAAAARLSADLGAKRLPRVRPPDAAE